MSNHLIIAGHGMQRDGRFDPGATGVITKGEHKYMVEDLFPAMRKFLPKNHNVVFFTKHKVSNHGDLLRLAKQYNATEVTEFHYDAATQAARKGHVIVHSNKTPDNMDVALRNAIRNMLGVRYSHKGYSGMSGRSNLYNVNLAHRNGLNYRLLELGFGTNPQDANIMVNQVDEYAKELVKAITGTTSDKPVKVTNTPSKHSNPSSASKTINQMATEVIDNKHGNGHANRQKSLGINNAEYSKVRAEVNSRLTGSKPKAPTGKSIKQMASEINRGLHGNGHANRRRSLGISNARYQEVRNYINRGVTSTPGKSINQMAKEIIDGKHGQGHANRQRSLGISSSQYAKVRSRVNQLM